ncbi:hypothetical protein ACU8KH_04098 [Lachancea thermotolerans]
MLEFSSLFWNSVLSEEQAERLVCGPAMQVWHYACLFSLWDNGATTKMTLTLALFQYARQVVKQERSLLTSEAW